MGGSILSSLSAAPSGKAGKPTEIPGRSNPLQGDWNDARTVSYVDDVAAEVIAVTDYAEVELDASTGIEVATGEHCTKGEEAYGSLVVLPGEAAVEQEVGEAGEEASQDRSVGGSDINHPLVNKDYLASSQDKVSAGPHDCPDCEKKFKFASSLIAHSVIHTGERPHRCNDCGRCFSFRQSLDRHRHTHRTGRKYDCVSLSGRTKHELTHMAHRVYACHHCGKGFNWELALARHLKTHADDHNENKPTASSEEGQEVAVGDENISNAPVAPADSDGRLRADDGGGGGGEPEVAAAQSSERATPEPKGTAPEPDTELVTPATVRTSGRKRKPTMKIQVIDLQKHMGSKRRRINNADPLELRPMPLNW